MADPVEALLGGVGTAAAGHRAYQLFDWVVSSAALSAGDRSCTAVHYSSTSKGHESRDVSLRRNMMGSM